MRWSNRPESSQSALSERFFYCLSSLHLAAKPRTGIEQLIHGRAIVACLPMPAILRSVNRPHQWRALVIVVRIFERWMLPQDQPDQFRVPVPCGPMQRSGMVLAECVHRQTRSDHQATGDGVIIPRGVRYMPSHRCRHTASNIRILGEQRIHKFVVMQPACIEQFFFGGAVRHQQVEYLRMIV